MDEGILGDTLFLGCDGEVGAVWGNADGCVFGGDGCGGIF